MPKTANIVIVGGTIAAGKSTLVEMLSKETGWPAISELREGDKVQDIILKKLYEGNRIHLATVQYYFISNRYRQYKEISNNLVTSILDRGLWEDWIFSKLLMRKEPKSYEHYKKLWDSTLKKVIENFGKPKAYIFVKVDWETFRQRIYSRNREVEISNFSKNEEYFKELLEEYNANFEDILKKWDVDYISIDSINLDKEHMLEKTLEELRKRELI